MNDSLDVQIRRQLSRYLAGEITLDDFYSWLAPATWDVHLTGNTGAEELAYDLDLWMAEYTSGHRTEPELRDLFSEVQSRYTVKTAGASPAAFRSGASARTVTAGSQQPARPSLPLAATALTGQVRHFPLPRAA